MKALFVMMLLICFIYACSTVPRIVYNGTSVPSVHIGRAVVDSLSLDVPRKNPQIALEQDAKEHAIKKTVTAIRTLPEFIHFTPALVEECLLKNMGSLGSYNYISGGEIEFHIRITHELLDKIQACG